MIKRETVDRIIDAARIEEVVGDFITLKKRGVNLLGLCPFHQEKSPSFTVSTAKGIYKCFGCGKAGNSVNFIMEHESLSYPEALKYLAAKYNIEVEEKEITPEERAQQNERESLFIVTSYAQKFFSETLLSTDLGQSIGLGYFKERGFRDDIIEKFQLGYSVDERKSFTQAALNAGYKAEYLVRTGLCILSDKHIEGEEIKLEHLFDRYSGRVIFPIQNLTGRVIGFGGRILSSEKKLAKYINSPQTEIYDKSKVLYGLNFAKKAIVQDDNCFLVEGYTDVISMNQSGIENVVSSSGTSLTVDQIKLIHRFTNNITILYDGDLAGIKASFRGIDLILAEGMNVKVLLFPEGDDPDSYSKKVSNEEYKEFIKKNSNDFIRFKTNLLFEEAKDDPIKRSALIREIVESIAIIPDSITRSVYIKECSSILSIAENILIIESNKIRKTKGDKRKGSDTPDDFLDPITELEDPTKNLDREYEIEFDPQEKNIIRLLINYGQQIVEIPGKGDDGEPFVFEMSIANYIILEMTHDDIRFINPIHQMFMDEFLNKIKEDVIPDAQYFTHHENPVLSQLAIELTNMNHEVSENWVKKYKIHVAHESHDILKTVTHDLMIYKEKLLQKLIHEERKKLEVETDDDVITEILMKIHKLGKFKSEVNLILGRIIVR